MSAAPEGPGLAGPPPRPIRVLPPELAERIAAGEVVERPVSVVKELVDNALDADAEDVRIDVEGGGLRLIRVADDGRGIPADQLELAFQRHATSKIGESADLLEIATLGFRGEALPSIAAVAEVDIASSTDEGGRAMTLGLRAGRVERRGTRGRPRGTTVWVRNLFQPIPARLKLTRNPRTESAAISQLVRRYALARPEVRFSLVLDGHPSLKTSGTGRLETALAEVFGQDVSSCLLPLPERAVGPQITGHVSAPGLSRPSRQSCIVFVNRRWVACPPIQQALEAAYRPLLPPGRHPIVVIFVEVPPGAVDVNVHPSKAEVRLLWEADLAAAVGEAVREAIGRSPRRPDDEQDFALAATQYRLPTPSRRVAERGDSLWELDAATPSMQLQLIGQLQNTVLLAEGRGGLYVVDQHRAHERIIYEQLSARHVRESEAAGSPDEFAAPGAQYLLEPVVVEVPPGRAELLGDRLAALESLGFSCERFGGHSFLVRSAPDVPEASRRALLDDVLEEASAEREDWRERLLIRLACRSAIRRGRRLTLPEATRLLEQLGRAATPAVCPHGAPIVLHFGRKFLERQFAW